MNECTCNDSGTCSTCRETRKKESQNNKPPKVIKNPKRTPIKKKVVEKKPIDLEALKGKNVQLKSSKRVLSEEDIIAKQKEKERLKKEKEKLKRKAKREEKKYQKAEMLKVMQKLARFVDGDTCCTCGKEFTKSLIANGGHGVKASKAMSTALLLRNIHSQCNSCNIFLDGNQFLYAKFVDKQYGSDTFQFLTELSNVQYNFSKSDLKELREKAEHYIKISEHAKLDEKNRLRHEFMNWQESTQWYKEILEKLQK
jgi:Bacteriophage Lambda NinG protein